MSILPNSPRQTAASVHAPTVPTQIIDDAQQQQQQQPQQQQQSQQQPQDNSTEEMIEKILEMSENVRNIMISAAINDLEQKNKEITGSSATYRVNKLATEVVKYFMGQ